MKVNIKDLKWYGRNFDYKGVRYFDYSCSGFEFCFTGKKAVATILSDPNRQKKSERGIIGVYVTEVADPSKYKGSSFWESFPSGKDFEPVRLELTKEENECLLFESPVEKTGL